MTKYFGVIGNRDHIKIQGERRPFWEFLDRQPDGWLSSLKYLPLKDFSLPSGPKIADCGAWSYKDDLLSEGVMPSLRLADNVSEPDIRKAFEGKFGGVNWDNPVIDSKLLESLGFSLKKIEVTPENVLSNYQVYFSPGDLVVAPDHMLIPGLSSEELKLRRQFNIQSAKDFLPIANAAGFWPMATVHGMDLEERLINIGRLYEIGYRHFSLGGMAARASQKRVLLESIIALKGKIRALLPDAYIHVLGLSSPDYWAAFSSLGIDSCDGSSHFKQAFTAGAFFTVEAGKLVKHRAGRIDRASGALVEPADVPECPCMACSKLRGEGVDTRYYGSNESNMGRAAHNLNMLMQAQHEAVIRGIAEDVLAPISARLDAMITRVEGAILPRVALVSCVSKKRDKPSTAFDLYQTPLFDKMNRYTLAQGYDHRFVLSAKYGLLAESETVEPYEMTLNVMTGAECKAWAERTFQQILKALPNGASLDIYAGKKYRQHLLPLLESAGYRVNVPLEGLGIGRQLAWLDARLNSQLSLFGEQ